MGGERRGDDLGCFLRVVILILRAEIGDTSSGLKASSKPFVRSSCATEPGGLVMMMTGPLPPIASIIAFAAVLPPSTLDVTTWLATNDGSLTTVSTVMIFVPAPPSVSAGKSLPLASAGEMMAIVGARAVTASTTGACNSPVK